MPVPYGTEGKTKIVDIGDSELPERFPKLKQKEFFQSAVIEGGSVAWGDLHVDLDELIYDCPEVVEKELPATGSFCERIAELTKASKT